MTGHKRYPKPEADIPDNLRYHVVEQHCRFCIFDRRMAVFVPEHEYHSFGRAAAQAYIMNGDRHSR